MVRIGTREFGIPLWLWAALPFVFMIEATANHIWWGWKGGVLYSRDPGHEVYLVYIRLLAMGALTGFLLADLMRRVRLPWYGVPVLVLASSGAASFMVAQWYVLGRLISGVLIGSLIGLAASPPGSSSVGAKLAVLLALPLGIHALAAVAIALVTTVICRLAGGLPLLTKDAWREFLAHMVAALVWLLLAIGGAAAIALSTRASPPPGWVPLLAACGTAIAATILHLVLVLRSRDPEPAGQFRLVAVTALCVAAFLYNPSSFNILGVSSGRFYFNTYRPALRAVGLLPTPAMKVAGHTIRVPYHDNRTRLGPPARDGGSNFVSVDMPSEYGAGIWVIVHRRDTALGSSHSHLQEHRKELIAEESKRTGDVVVHRAGVGTRILALRTSNLPEIELYLGGIKPEVPSAQAEEALRRFAQERIKPKP